MRKGMNKTFLLSLFIGVTCLSGAFSQEAEAATHNVPGDYSTIQGCIDAAVDGDTCLVGPGTYFENLLITKAVSLVSTDGAANTIIDGTNSGRVVQFRDQHGDAVLDGFTITNGAAPDGLGGGIYIEHAVPLITNCDITGNSALSGGGIGAYYLANVRIVNSSITGNTATGTLNSGMELSCIAPAYSFTLEGGGGIAVECASFTTINNSDISGNTAAGNGGGMRLSHSAVFNQYSFVTGNTSSASGGGIHALYTDYLDASNVVAGNSAVTGGGMYFDYPGGNIRLINSTVADNTADVGGGFYAPQEAIKAANMILYGNTSLSVFSSNICIIYSDIEGGFPGEGNIDLDPSFVDALNINYDLNPDSPCIDTGTADMSICANNISMPVADIVGTSRPQSAFYDMGAYEILCVPTNDREKGKTCRDGIDNDCDNLVDGDDPDCGGTVCTPTEPVETTCNDGEDNDCDGLTDGADPDCPMVCENYTDKETCNVDPGCEWVGKGKNGMCVDATPCTPTSSDEFGLCDDGIDNDCDGVADCDDTDECETDPVCQVQDCSGYNDPTSCEAADCRWNSKKGFCR